MKYLNIVFLTLLFFCSFSQDTLLPKKKSELFIKLFTGLTTSESAPLNQQYVNSFTTNEEVRNPAFYAGYADTTARRKNLNRHGGDRVYKSNNYGSVTPQLGISLEMTFKNKRPGLIKRITPQLSVFHSKRKFFGYNVRAIEKFSLDTLYYVDPKYPPIIRDSASYKNIYYQYSSKQIYLQAGVAFHLIHGPRYIFHVGAQYAFGKSYHNEFYVRKETFAETIREPISQTISRTEEPSSFSSRTTIPVGFQLKLGKQGHSAWACAEFSPGYETYKIKGGRRVDKAICLFIWGLRFPL